MKIVSTPKDPFKDMAREQSKNLSQVMKELETNKVNAFAQTASVVQKKQFLDEAFMHMSKENEDVLRELSFDTSQPIYIRAFARLLIRSLDDPMLFKYAINLGAPKQSLSEPRAVDIRSADKLNASLLEKRLNEAANTFGGSKK
jgi:reverse gyrase